MTGVFVTLNAGSSSLKCAVYSGDRETIAQKLHASITGIGRAPDFHASGVDGAEFDPGDLAQLDPSSGHMEVIALLLTWLKDHLDGHMIIAVGHRVVHGGSHYAAPVLITKDVLMTLDTLVPLAPLHQPHNLAAIRAVADWKPDIPQIACFDTGFHHTQDRLARLIALPRWLREEGVQRYGFHGLSYDYIAGVLPNYVGERADGRVVVAHLGNGSSMCAMKGRQSVATSMGFTALDGLVMGRRSGAVDPGILLYLMQSKGMSAAEIETLLYQQSGLLGVSGISNAMQVLEASGAPEAEEAIDFYCYRAAASLSALLPAISGLDILVFTAGIGENSARVRRQICGHLGWLGAVLDTQSNDANATCISASGSALDVLVLPTDEEEVIARACRRLVL